VGVVAALSSTAITRPASLADRSVSLADRTHAARARAARPGPGGAGDSRPGSRPRAAPVLPCPVVGIRRTRQLVSPPAARNGKDDQGRANPPTLIVRLKVGRAPAVPP